MGLKNFKVKKSNLKWESSKNIVIQKFGSKIIFDPKESLGTKKQVKTICQKKYGFLTYYEIYMCVRIVCPPETNKNKQNR